MFAKFNKNIKRKSFFIKIDGSIHMSFILKKLKFKINSL